MRRFIYVLIHYFIGGTLIFPSISKILGERFVLDGSNDPIDSYFHLFEVLYRAEPYWRFLGVSQFIAGLLIITFRYKHYGYILAVSIFLNIYFINLSYYFGFTTYLSLGIILLLIVLIFNDNRLNSLTSQTIRKSLFFYTYNPINLDILFGLLISGFSIYYGIEREYPQYLFCITLFLLIVYCLLIYLNSKYIFKNKFLSFLFTERLF